MAIAYRSQASQPNATRTGTTVNMPAGVQAGDVVLVFCATGASAEVAITPPASLSSNPVVNRSYSDTSPPWTVNMRIYRYTVTGSGDPASFAFTHASAGSEALAIAFSGVDTTTPIDATPTTNAGEATTAVALGLTTVTNGAWLVVWRGSWDGNAITPPAGWTERLDQPVTWVATQEWATAGPTGDFNIPAGNGGAYPYGTILLPLRPAGGGPSPITGTLTASTPALTAGPPTTAITGTVAAPTYSGGVAANLPPVDVGPPAVAASGTVTAPTYAGDLAAATAALTIGPPVTTWTGTTAPPAYSGTVDASTPAVTVGPPTTVVSGTITAPGSNILAADLPTIVIGPPTSSITGTVTPPVYAGGLTASTPAVIVGPAELAATGTIAAPAVTGTLAASLPTITVGPLTAAIFDSSIPPLPLDGVSLTVDTGTRSLTLTAEARSLEVTT